MTHLVNKEKIERAGVTLTEGIVFGGFAACALAAVLFDLRHLIG